MFQLVRRKLSHDIALSIHDGDFRNSQPNPIFEVANFDRGNGGFDGVADRGLVLGLIPMKSDSLMLDPRSH